MHSGFPDPRHIVKLSGVSFAVTEFISGLQNAVLSTMHLPAISCRTGCVSSMGFPPDHCLAKGLFFTIHFKIVMCDLSGTKHVLQMDDLERIILLAGTGCFTC